MASNAQMDDGSGTIPNSYIIRLHDHLDEGAFRQHLSVVADRVTKAAGQSKPMTGVIKTLQPLFPGYIGEFPGEVVEFLRHSPEVPLAVPWRTCSLD